MKKTIAYILILVVIVASVGGKTYATGQESVWNETVNYKDKVDCTDQQLIDTESFSEMIGTSDEYFIIPLYNLQNLTSAYLIQYYAERKPLSYIVVNTNAKVTDDYYITFGVGDFAELVGLYEIDFSFENISVCYCGGALFYLKADETLFFYNGYLEELDDEIVFGLEEQTEGGTYYNYGETLNLTAVFNKEVGYISCPSFTRSTSFTKRTMDDTRYSYGSGIVCYNHCSPTAGVNLFQYLYTIEGKTYLPMSSWQSVFVALHTAMGTTNTGGTNPANIAPGYQSVLRSYGYNNATATCTTSATWSQVTSAIDTCAVHLGLHSSEIYGNHGVVGLGYVSFIHSTGWVSKYYIIVDGWTADIRFVHSSLGIDSVNLITLNIG